jgi:hypothetical protein
MHAITLLMWTTSDNGNIVCMNELLFMQTMQSKQQVVAMLTCVMRVPCVTQVQIAASSQQPKRMHRCRSLRQHSKF